MSDYRPARVEVRALKRKLFFIRIRQAARAGYDRMRLGTGTSERLAAAFVLSGVFVLLIVAVSFAIHLDPYYTIAGSISILVFFFGLSAILILWASDGQLADDSAETETRLERARNRAAWEEQERLLDEERREDEKRRENIRRRGQYEDDDRPRGKPRERQSDGYRCPYCRTREYPQLRTKVSAAGWMFFWLTCLFLCWPICWIGLLITETYRECPSCGARS